ncbi:MAG TPA: ATP-binding protein [Acidimicrobiales bacterium]|nr:ATP-binding protein [Acidimicrobiales bacterium]
MRPHPRLLRLAGRPRLPRHTVRLRLTVLYGLLFLLSGAALLVITNVLVTHAEAPAAYRVKVTRTSGGAVVRISGSVVSLGSGSGSGPGPGGVHTGALFAGVVGPPSQNPTQLSPRQARSLAGTLQSGIDTLRTRQLDDLRLFSAIALALMAVLSMWLGWVMAGRALRPLRAMTSTTRDISATNLHARLALEGPDDELHELGRTINDLLARLETSFEGQRRFVANASHELRTPLARQHTLAQVALADPEASVEDLRAAHERILVSGGQQERLIEALLTLARGEAGLEHREPVDLSVVVEGALLGMPASGGTGVAVRADVMPATVMGDPRLIERLVANLLDNAVRHNVPGGEVEVSTGVRHGEAVLSIANTGPVIAPAELDRLFQPFQRLGPDRTAQGGGLGLGLSIVRAIASAHDATVEASARPGGGLRVELRMAAVAAGPALDQAAAPRPSGVRLSL